MLSPAKSGWGVRTVADVSSPLSRLAPGRQGVVMRVLDGPSSRRMMDLGLVPGTALAVVRCAPLGDPIQVAVRGSWLCLRRSEADAVLVAIAP